MSAAQWAMKTEIGTFYVIASQKGLQGVLWKKTNAPIVKSLKGPEKEIKILAKTVRQLEEYMSGKRKNFDLPFDITGTKFQRQVWNALSKIPYGKTCAYKDIARAVKNKKAMRAVGTANGRNPLSIIVPCHRVIAADGTLGGYGGGLDIKKKLLAIEGKILA